MNNGPKSNSVTVRQQIIDAIASKDFEALERLRKIRSGEIVIIKSFYDHLKISNEDLEGIEIEFEDSEYTRFLKTLDPDGSTEGE